MGLLSFLRKDPWARQAGSLYDVIALHARAPRFFAEWGVPDTLDGRFDMLSLHAFLAIDRIAGEPFGPALNQALFNAMFAHLDQTLREIGVQDLGVGRRIKIMAEGFHGRSMAFGRALGEGSEALDAVLQRNVYGRTPAPPEGLAALAAYVVRARAALAQQPAEALAAGRIAFPQP